MELFDKIRLSLIKRGVLSLSKLDSDCCDDEEFVEEAIKAKGIQEFQHAGSWLRSDAEYILKLVEKYPQVVQYCDKIVYDRYIKDQVWIEEIELDKVFFAALCCEKNITSFKYLDEASARGYMELVKSKGKIVDSFHGKEKVVDFANEDEDKVDLLNYIRYDIVKTKDFLSNKI